MKNKKELKNLLIKAGPNSNLMKEYKNSLIKLNNEQLEASIGLILGDASLQSQNNGKTYRLKFEWSDKSKPYIDHIFNLFDEWVISYPHKKERISPKGNLTVNWGFQTITHQAFNPLADLFLYENNIISQKEKDLLHLKEKKKKNKLVSIACQLVAQF